jgi:predicted O-methyltransferase YrrM
MTGEISQRYPAAYLSIAQATKESGFTMASDVLTCSLLRTLAGAKPRGKLLELGTGTGLSTSWILDGMDEHSTLISVDNAPEFLTIAQQYLEADKRLHMVNSDDGQWIAQNRELTFDYIFADT